MAKLPIILTLLCFSTLIANSKSLSQESKTINPKPINVYLFSVVEGGLNASIYEVARASISALPTNFGLVYVQDNDLRAGPDTSSRLLGRNQGTTTNTGLNEPSAVVDYSFKLNTGKYKGSSLKLDGQLLIFVPNQEIPITGGTGVFRGARGYAIATIISFDPTTSLYVILFKLYVAGGSIIG